MHLPTAATSATGTTTCRSPPCRSCWTRGGGRLPTHSWSSPWPASPCSACPRPHLRPLPAAVRLHLQRAGAGTAAGDKHSLRPAARPASPQEEPPAKRNALGRPPRAPGARPPARQAAAPTPMAAATPAGGRTAGAPTPSQAQRAAPRRGLSFASLADQDAAAPRPLAAKGGRPVPETRQQRACHLAAAIPAACADCGGAAGAGAVRATPLVHLSGQPVPTAPG